MIENDRGKMTKNNRKDFYLNGRKIWFLINKNGIS